jgi:hypothetical protein
MHSKLSKFLTALSAGTTLTRGLARSMLAIGDRRHLPARKVRQRFRARHWLLIECRAKRETSGDLQCKHDFNCRCRFRIEVERFQKEIVNKPCEIWPGQLYQAMEIAGTGLTNVEDYSPSQSFYSPWRHARRIATCDATLVVLLRPGCAVSLKMEDLHYGTGLALHPVLTCVAKDLPGFLDNTMEHLGHHGSLQPRLWWCEMDR